MIATLLFAAVTAAAPAPADDFKTLCLATKGDVAAVTAATAAQQEAIIDVNIDRPAVGVQRCATVLTSSRDTDR